MSEESEFIELETENIQDLSHRRILFLMGLVTAVGSICGFAFVAWKFGLGILLGGTLSFVNYYWLKHSLQVVFGEIARGETEKLSATRYLFRYIILLGALLAISLVKIIPIASVILGLGSFAFAVVFEGIIRLITSFKK